MSASDTSPPLTDEELQAFCDAAPERIDTPLWTHLDWSLWGTGLGDTLREPMASAMVAAIPAEVRAHAEMVMAEFLKFRGVESPAEANAELRAELKMARAQTCSRRDLLVAEEMMRQAQEEAHRLRAELETVASEADAQCREAAARTVRAEKERDAAVEGRERADRQIRFHLDVARGAERERDALAAKLAAARELHTMERRFTDENFETSYDTPQEAAEALGISPGSAQYLDVCSHCGSIEMDAGAEDYKDSLWPCPTAATLSETGGTER